MLVQRSTGGVPSRGTELREKGGESEPGLVRKNGRRTSPDVQLLLAASPSDAKTRRNRPTAPNVCPVRPMSPPFKAPEAEAEVAA